jgi:alpha-L-fucosidase 2
MNKKLQLFLTVIFTFIYHAGFCQQSNLQLWYNKPATHWEETLPLGNGRLGMMPDGGINRENIVLNDITLWSGSPQDANNYDAYKSLPRIRKLLAEGKNDEAQVLVDSNYICKGPGSGSGNGANVAFGCYQVLGKLSLKFSYNGQPADTTKLENYKRTLSLNNAIATCSYKVGAISYAREYFTSFGNDVSLVKLTADKPGQLNFTISLSRPERALVKAGDGMLQLYGQLSSGTTAPGMKYLAQVKPVLNGGSIGVKDNMLVIKNATSVILYISAGTDFKNPHYQAKVSSSLYKAAHTAYAAEKTKHLSHYRKLFNRLHLSIGNQNKAGIPTDERLVSYHNNPDADPGFPVLFYQFGRYLSICSTRVGLLPPNLQGLWANEVQTPWNGDYHLDINVQMNHWPLEVANLPELDLPLTALVKGMVKNGERTAKAYYNADGWIAHVITNVWGFTEPGESASWGIAKSGSGWLCNNLWEHYAFTMDKNYLAEIYPVIKGSAQFYNSTLVHNDKTGWLVTSPSSSPENSFYLPNGKTASICEGPTIDNQILRELFTNVITASKILGKDEAFRNLLIARLKQLPPAGQVGKDGRLMEWLEDYKETEPHHRHIAHLYGLYPAPLITPELTPELAEACKKTLNARGDDGPSWSIAYKQLFWARLHDGNRAYKLFTEMTMPTLKTNINYGAGGGVYPNLLTAGPPFQIDGNFGAEAGISEMLIQSHAGFIELLPAIPDAWKAKGEIKGMKARGNFTVDFKWKDGKVINYRISSPNPRKVRLKINGELKTITAEKA